MERGLASGVHEPGKGANSPQIGATAHATTADGCSVSGEGKDRRDDMNVSASDQDDDTTSNPYSKPPGEPNRPNSRGYSLVDKLIKDGKWTKQQYQRVMDRVHEMAKNELNISLSYREQSEKRKFKICEQMAKEYPILQHYPDICQ
ncbi:hypothetical protein IW261DRAFT_1560346 [Armillaria novae-zelandiae]|uniref:Uncharacterized protein n=1 Tax=Armillaria novae-zelandiae TaxID=153914 RepID=A0AA39TEV8_9AGAR|nr:hypothetical protein IW261DRAFT_1560346 [Armillaria novae-zelandiae]